MNQELIPISPDSAFPVDARHIHAFVESKQQFTDWIKGRISAFGFVEGIDWERCSTLLHNVMMYADRASRAPRRDDYFVTVDMAKQLCMLENNTRGRELRLYFIRREQQAIQLQKQSRMPTHAEALEGWAAEIRIREAIEARVELLEPKAAFADQIQAGAGWVDVATAAKELNIPDLGPHKLREWMAERKWIYKRKTWLPSAPMVEREYMRLDARIYDREIKDEHGRKILDEHGFPRTEPVSYDVLVISARGLEFLFTQRLKETNEVKK